MHAKSQGFVVSKAAYAKDKLLVRPASTVGVTRAHRLIEHLGGRWTHRERGYVMSAPKVKKLYELYEGGWDATRAIPRFGVKSKLEGPRMGSDES